MRLLTACILLVQTIPAFAGPMLSEKMVNAKTVDEFIHYSSVIEAERRGLQDDFLSERDEYGPLLAEEYGGEPGFYHGVASGGMNLSIFYSFSFEKKNYFKLNLN